MIVASETEWTSTTAASWHSRISWGSLFAGCFAALSVHLLLTMLFVSLGVALVNPEPNSGDLPELSVAAGLAWSVSALIALWIGGWVAGRTGPRGPGSIGGIHGMLVWSLATVVMFVFVSGGSGLLVGGALKAVGGGVATAASAAQKSSGGATGILDSFLEEAVGPEAGRNPAVNPARLRREVGAALMENFRERSPDRRSDLVNALMNAGGRSREDAERLVQEWDDAYTRSVATAKAAASRAAKKLAAVATWTAFAFVLGAIAATWGGRMGGRRNARLEIEQTAAGTA